MTGLLVHFAVAAAGLAAVGGIVRLGEVLLGRDPVAVYRLAVRALAAVLLLAAAQAGAAALDGLLNRPAVVERQETHFEWFGPGPPPPFPTPASPGGGIMHPPTWAEWGLAAYAAGVGAVGLYHGRRLRRTVAFFRTCRPLDDAAALAAWRRVAAGSALRERARLLTHPGLAAPCCWGLGRPCVVVPDSVPAITDLEWALRHELTHLERGDSHVAVLQTCLTALFWFHPVAWWLSRRLDEWRELSCDYLVVSRTGQRKRYALALLGFAARRPAAALMTLGADFKLRRRLEVLAAGAGGPTRQWPGRCLYAVLAFTALAQLTSAAWPGVAAVRDQAEHRVLDVEVRWRPPDGPAR